MIKGIIFKILISRKVLQKMCSTTTAKGSQLQNCPVKCPKDLTKKIFVKDNQNCRLLFTIGKTGEPVRGKFYFLL
jgi:hypothetical protein